MMWTSNSWTGFLRCAAAAAMLSTFPVFAQVQPLPPDLGAMASQRPVPPPVNPDPRNFAGSWKAASRVFTPNDPAAAVFMSSDMQAHRHCLPDFAPYSSVEGNADFVPTHNLLVILFEDEHRIRRIRLGGTHPANLMPSYWGDSIGHWEGNTLVVDTTGVKGRLVANGPLVSPRMTMTERFRKIDGGAVLEDRISFADPAGEKLPAPVTVRLNWTKPQEVLEWICEDAGQVYFGNKK